MPTLLALGAAATFLTWTLAVLSCRWLLTGRRPRLLERSSRFGAYLAVVAAASTTISWIDAVPMLLWWNRPHPLLPQWVGFAMINGVWLAPLAALPVAFAIDRAGRRRQQTVAGRPAAPNSISGT